MSSHKGSISQVIGPVIDVEYDKSGSTMPKIHDALEIDRQDGKKLIIEVQQHIGEDTVRCVAMATLERGDIDAKHRRQIGRASCMERV